MYSYPWFYLLITHIFLAVLTCSYSEYMKLCVRQVQKLPRIWYNFWNEEFCVVYYSLRGWQYPWHHFAASCIISAGVFVVWCNLLVMSGVFCILHLKTSTTKQRTNAQKMLTPEQKLEWLLLKTWSLSLILTVTFWTT